MNRKGYLHSPICLSGQSHPLGRPHSYHHSYRTRHSTIFATPRIFGTQLSPGLDNQGQLLASGVLEVGTSSKVTFLRVPWHTVTSRCD